MPRWTFYLSPNTLTQEEKGTIARKVTDLYIGLGIPAFWINVFFHEVGEGNFYSGGKYPPNAVFFHMDHAARKIASEEVRDEFIRKVNDIVRPILDPKGIKWEYNIYEHLRDNWRINGMIPPMDHPEVLEEWRERNAPVVYEGAYK
ncbi:putative oxalocrotonate tautomerase [Aspergillus caelatus]|uniref:Putative oxalocrotonate tautomerase n=1 Tax=Aspergillus caelatus TaxID=61420 RepID=A0A5N6ZNB9_9EURO|nr:putative oxalocrotonate tautomerase [Aspergillus caelatus]KAE8358945.1 putative oxalocrotonate tautomerase [Aspergillus caelatus]